MSTVVVRSWWGCSWFALRGLRPGAIYRAVLLGLAWFGFAWLVDATFAAEPSAKLPPGSRISEDDVLGAQRQVEQDDGLSAEQKKQLVDVYRQCLDELHAAEERHRKADEFEAARIAAPQELAKLKAKLAKQVDESEPTIPTGGTLESLKQGLAKAEIQLKTARDEQLDLEAQQRHRDARWDEVRKLDDEATRRVAEIFKALNDAATAESSNPAAARAEKMLLESQRINVLAERAVYAAELPSYEASRELLRLRLDAAVHRANLADKAVNAWKDVVEAKAAAEADTQARDAHRALVAARPETLPLAEENDRLTQLRQGPTSPAARLKWVRQAVAHAQQQLKRLRADFNRMKQVAGISNELGQLLLNQRRGLPNLKELADEAKQRNEEIARTKVELLTLETQRSELADVEVAVQRTLGPLVEALDPSEEGDLTTAVRDLLTARRGYLDDLIADYNALFNALVLEWDKSERELLQAVGIYQNYIDEQILWIRSFSPAVGWSPADLKLTADKAFGWNDWLSLSRRWWNDFTASPQTWVIAIAAYGLLMFNLKRLRSAIHRLGREVTQNYTAGLWPTFRTALLTTLCALPAPAAVWFLAWRLTAWPGTTEFIRAFADAARTTAVVWLMVALVRQSLRRGGLAEAHFGYSGKLVDGVRRMLWRLAAVGIPATLFAALAQEMDHVTVQASLGRAAFILGMICLARAAHVIVHPQTGLLESDQDQESTEFERRWRRFRYWAACSALLIPAVLSAAGYHYTATQLAGRLQATLWLLLGYVFVRSLLLRGLLVARRRFTWAEVHRQREASNEPSGSAKVIVPEMSLATIDRQSHRLVNGFGAVAALLCLWWIWIDMLPALQFLERWQLYSYSVTITEPQVQGDGTTTVQEITKLEWITAADLAWAVIILGLAGFAVRNLPGLLELTCLKWLPLDSGSRYAATSMVRYLIQLATVIAVCNVVGLQWSSVQWLAAAMTVGLGFGLQEIFANFISGLIILFERPIRVGDTVTIGSVTGSVTRIRGRATTIVDGDRKELIVPNKEFITGQLINWTLTDDVLRTVLRIGINHGSDVQLAARLLLDTARKNPFVLSDPEPTVACTQLGQQQLEFELRVFSHGADTPSLLRHQLNVAILQAFHDAGIVIASTPQEFVFRRPESMSPAPRSERKIA
jgi:potassium efflux system protein